MIDNKYLNNRFYIVALCLISVSLFLNTFSSSYVYDDLVVVMNNPEIRQWNFWQGWGWMGRFTRTLTLTLDYKLFGESIYGYHVQNILWHTLSSLLLYAFFLRLSHDRAVSFLGALFFSVHPIHVEAVANVANRKEMICMSFFLISFLAYINFLERERKIKWIILALGAWFLALNSKQVAAVLPLLLIIYEFLFCRKEKRWLLKKPVLLLFCIITGAFLVSVYIFTIIDINKIGNVLTLGGHKGDVNYLSVLSTSSRAFWHYIKLLLFPFNLSPDYVIELSTFFEDPTLFILWSMQFLFLLSPFYFIKKSPLMAFGFFWFGVNYIPVSNVIPLTYLVADRYMYIPSAGFCLVMSVSCVSVYRCTTFSSVNTKTKNLIKLLISIIIISYSFSTFLYNSAWEDEESLWSHAVLVSPLSYKSHNNLGEVYIKKGEFYQAIKEFNRSLSIYTLSKTYVNRGNAYAYLGKYGEALVDYNKAIELAPDLTEAYYGLGTVYIDMKEFDKAVENLNRAVYINPSFKQAYNNLGNAYYNSGNREEAINSYSKAIELDPFYMSAYKNRAYVYMGAKDYSLAIKDYKKLIELGYDSAGIYYNLGLIYSRLADSKSSYYFFNKAAQLGDKRASMKLGAIK